MTIRYFLRYADWPGFRKEIPLDIIVDAMADRCANQSKIFYNLKFVKWWYENMTGPMQILDGQTIFLFDCGKIWIQRETTF